MKAVVKSLSLVVLVACVCPGWAPPVHADVVTDWNAITQRCVLGGPTPANRGGPPGLLDIALVQAAVHDAVQAIEGRFHPYRYANPVMRGVGSPEAAVAAASFGVLTGLYGADDPCLSGVTNPAVTYAGDNGLLVGAEAVEALLPLYRPAFASPIDPFVGGNGPGQWRPEPGVKQGAFTFMAYTTPFVLNRPSQFRPERQPPMNSEQYRREYDEVKAYGSFSGSARNSEQTDLAGFWVSPPSSWIAALRAIAQKNITGTGDKARLLALASLAAADAQITIYDSKYHFNFWRPSTAIHEGDGDGNPDTAGDASWRPFLPTPPYPEYSSGANCLSGAMVTTLQLFFGTDELAFSVSSPAVGLITNPRHYVRLSDAAQEMVDVRILQGIHFRSADEEGRRQGSRVAHWAFQKFLRPLAGGD
jgi:hypothetical protein